MLTRLKILFLDFLFPGSAHTATLYSLSSAALVQALPPSRFVSEHGVSALFDYQSPLVKQLIWEVKYRGSRELAAKVSALLYDTLVAELEEDNLFEKFAQILLVPMPTSDARRLERGWNQAELIAEALLPHDVAKRFAYAPRLLEKVRHTESQTRADRRHRLKNLEESMRVRLDTALTGALVIVVDDVVTTGATCNEARRALRAADAKKIICVALAH